MSVSPLLSSVAALVEALGATAVIVLLTAVLSQVGLQPKPVKISTRSPRRSF